MICNKKLGQCLVATSVSRRKKRPCFMPFCEEEKDKIQKKKGRVTGE